MNNNTFTHQKTFNKNKFSSSLPFTENEIVDLKTHSAVVQKIDEIKYGSDYRNIGYVHFTSLIDGTSYNNQQSKYRVLDKIVIALDCEWVDPKRGTDGKRFVLSQQYTSYVKGVYHTVVFVFPDKYFRYTLAKILKLFLQIIRVKGKSHAATNDSKQLLKNKNQELQICLICHYGKVDLSCFHDFNTAKILQNCSNIRDCLATTKPIGYKLYDCHNNSFNCHLTIRDTYLLSASGAQSLAELGNALKIHKVDIAEFNKGNMLELYKTNPMLYFAYSASDSYITLQWFNLILLDYSRKRFENIPITLGSIAVVTTKQILMKYLNVVKETEFRSTWLGQDAFSNKFERVVYEDDWQSRGIKTEATHCFHGGRNECFSFGYFKNDNGFIDVDLAGAYATAMSLLPDIDYSEPVIKLSNQLIDVDNPYFKHDSVGFGCVTFNFPEDTKYPCLPVKDRKGRGLIFPLSGESNCTSYEVFNALQMGCVITVNGWFIPCLMDNSFSMREVMIDLTARRSAAASKFGKKSPQELMAKEVANSVYGKLAQGLKKSRSYSVSQDSMQDTPYSKITNPIFACLITGLIRAILGGTMAELSKKGFIIHSVTTDGFITDATLQDVESCELNGMRDYFLSGRRSVTGIDELTSYWEVKHQQNELINITTRGNIGLDNVTSKYKGVFAKAGYAMDSIKYPTDEERKTEFATIFLNRQGCVKSTSNRSTSIKSIVKQHIDIMFHQATSSLRLDYDYKRKPINSQDVTFSLDLSGTTQQFTHVSFYTEPYPDIKAFDVLRSARDSNKKPIRKSTDVSQIELRSLISDSKKHRVRENTEITQLMNIFRLIHTNSITSKTVDLTSRKLVFQHCRAFLNISDVEYTDKQMIDLWKNAKKTSRCKNILDIDLLCDSLYMLGFIFEDDASNLDAA